MIRIIILCLIGVLLPAVAKRADAQQQKKSWRVGFMSAASPVLYSHLYAAFVQGMRDQGYVEGQNLVLETRWAEDKADRLPDMAAELVQLKVDLIAATGGAVSAIAAKNATATIPIVFVAGGDLVRVGLIDSLARPRGNLTGLSLLTTELGIKRLELLKETFPKIRRVAVMGNPANPAYVIQTRESQAAAKLLALQLELFEVRQSGDFEAAFAGTVEKGAGAALLLSDPMFNAHRERIAEIAVRRKVPAISEFKEFVERGGLMSYGTNIAEVYRRVGVYVDKIFKGAKPGEIPVEQPTNFEFFINLKTAKQIGASIPPNVLARADKVIK
jgi:putative ABC transport system substrate-binding protein